MEAENKHKLYLIPSPLGDKNPMEDIPRASLNIISKIKCYVVENTRSARRYLSAAGLKGHIEELEFYELNEHSSIEDIESLIKLLARQDVGLISEAGLPAVADPGAKLVELCHKHNIQVVPMVGPSSLMLALMASGFNGQSFAFCGYLPAKTEDRRSAIKNIEKQSYTLNQSQIFIETPYRNMAMLQDLLKYCDDETMLCLAFNLNLEGETIISKSIKEWKAINIDIAKKPCVFIIYKEKQYHAKEKQYPAKTKQYRK